MRHEFASVMLLFLVVVVTVVVGLEEDTGAEWFASARYRGGT